MVEEEDRESNFIGRRTGIVTSSSFFGPWGMGKFDFALKFRCFYFFIFDRSLLQEGEFQHRRRFYPNLDEKEGGGLLGLIRRSLQCPHGMPR